MSSCATSAAKRSFDWMRSYSASVMASKARARSPNSSFRSCSLPRSSRSVTPSAPVPRRSPASDRPRNSDRKQCRSRYRNQYRNDDQRYQRTTFRRDDLCYIRGLDGSAPMTAATFLIGTVTDTPAPPDRRRRSEKTAGSLPDRASATSSSSERASAIRGRPALLRLSIPELAERTNSSQPCSQALGCLSASRPAAWPGRSRPQELRIRHALAQRGKYPQPRGP